MKKQLFNWRVEWIAAAWLCLAATHLCAQAGGAQPSRQMEREFQAAMAAQDRGDLDQAQALLLALHTRHPGIFAVDESLGLIYVARENYAEALPLLEAAAHEQPSSDVAHANLGAAYFKLHRNREALSELEHAARLNPGNPQTQQGLGQLWMEAGKPQLAAEAFAKALAARPDDPDLMLTRAVALNAAGDTAAAEAAVSAIPGADQSAAAQSLLGEIAEKQGAFQKAAEHLARAQQLDPSEANAWMLGVELLRHWTFDPAIQEFEAATAKFPASVRLRTGLGAAYFGAAMYDKAVPVFADLLAAEPNQAVYAELLGMSCTAVMQVAKPRCAALVDYGKAHPRDARALTFAAATLLDGAASDDQLQLAARLLADAIKADPKLADAQFEMGLLEQNRSSWPASIPYLEAAVALKPDYAQAHYRLALAYWRAGRKQEGQAEMELQKKYSKQQQEDLDQRLRQITTFLVDVRNP